VQVLPIADSFGTGQKLTDSSGFVSFQLHTNKPYLLRVTSVNYLPLQKNITIAPAQDTIMIEMATSGKTLNNVVVTSSRPLVRQEDDKTIVDPENLASSSTNGYEILEKTPGLFVDQDGNIYLTSTTPASIQINGRELKMSAPDIATMLKSLPPNAIASIEILRTPSARYDASGSGGLVNIILRKGVKIGLTGSINAGLNQGTYGNQILGVNLNNNNGITTTYLNIQYSRRNNYERIKTDRIFAPDSMLQQDAFTKYPTGSYYLGYGLSKQLNKRWEVVYDGRISFNDFDNNSTNFSDIKKISSKDLVTSNQATVQTKGNTLNVSQGISSKFKWDSLGSEWTSDLTYSYAPSETVQNFSTLFTQPFFREVGGDGAIDAKLHFVSGQTNLIWKLPKKLTLESGLKSGYVGFKNEADYFRNTGNGRVPDAARTASYRYKENINAAFLQASKNINGIVIKTGARVENTNMVGRQLTPKDTSFTIHRTDLFPYVYISRNLFKIMTYDLRAYLVYRRTISRPGYELLNPYPRLIDQYLFETGNPSLRPQFTQNYEANVSVDERPIVALGVNDTKDIFTNVVYQSDTSKSVAYRTYDNLGKNKEVYFRALGAIPPGKRYFIVAGFQYNRNFYEGLYEGKPLSFKKGSWSIFSYQTFKITPQMQLTLNGFARFKGQLQFYELSSFGAVNASLTQQLLNKKLIVTFSATDLFFTNNNTFNLKQGTVNATGYRENDSRRFSVNVRYNFGFRKREEGNLFSIESPEKAN
jgi:hypothetical protein